ncbi:MAG: HEAT repeat domain-containing protein [Candidatus Eisenbacteria bacterium]|nr:HEAT repeat domain-containing protein [Candidatus Eisenbacteria bacterium]
MTAGLRWVGRARGCAGWIVGAGLVAGASLAAGTGRAGPAPPAQAGAAAQTGAKTSQAGALVAQTVPEPPDSAVLAALGDSSLAAREWGYAEAGRRRLAAAVPLALRRLEAGELADGREYMAAEAYAMIRMLGAVGDTAALRPLSELTKYPDFTTRVEAVRALGALTDSRAAPLLRAMARGPCRRIPYALLQALAFSLGRIGDSTDAPLFRRWAHQCPRIRNEALEGLGLTSGMDALRREVRAILGPHPPRKLAHELHLLEIGVQHERLEREGKI